MLTAFGSSWAFKKLDQVQSKMKPYIQIGSVLCYSTESFSFPLNNSLRNIHFTASSILRWGHGYADALVFKMFVYAPPSTKGCFKLGVNPHEGLSVNPCICVLVTQLCLTLCDPVDCSPPGSSVHGILQAKILEWVAFLSPLNPHGSR